VQLVSPVAQPVVTHAPPTHDWPAVHACPQVPQLFASLASSTQNENPPNEQSEDPGLQSHAPPPTPSQY